METVPLHIENKLKIYTNQAHKDFQDDPEYDLSWEQQLEEFKQAYLEGWLKESFIDFAIGS